jgi:predicted O-methyltransferase YrrM
MDNLTVTASGELLSKDLVDLSDAEAYPSSPFIQELLKNKYVEGLDNSIVPIPSDAIPLDMGLFLYRFLKKRKISKTIEVGLGFGTSAMFILDAITCTGDKDAGHVAIDPAQKDIYNNIGLDNVEKTGFVEQLWFLNKKDYIILPWLLDQDKKFEFAFVDAMKRFDHLFLNFFYLDKLIPVGGYIAFDDCAWGEVRQISYNIVRKFPYRIVERYQDLITGEERMLVFQKTGEFSYF